MPLVPNGTLAVHQEDVARVRASGVEPRVAVVLGSGFSDVTSVMEGGTTIPYSQLTGFPHPKVGVVGHAGELVLGHIAGVPVMAFRGRVHGYQGVSACDAAYTARLAASVGAEILVVTNAAGGVNSEFRVGDVVVLSDQINLTADSPLVGWSGPDGGTPFVAMDGAYDAELRVIAGQVAESDGMYVRSGTYAGLPGPAFETPAEVAYLRAIGADVVGMSTVHEVVVARAMGMRVLGFSLVTNAAGGEGLDHEEVLEAGKAAQRSVSALLAGILQRL